MLRLSSTVSGGDTTGFTLDEARTILGVASDVAHVSPDVLNDIHAGQLASRDLWRLDCDLWHLRKIQAQFEASVEPLEPVELFPSLGSVIRSWTAFSFFCDTIQPGVAKSLIRHLAHVTIFRDRHPEHWNNVLCYHLTIVDNRIGPGKNIIPDAWLVPDQAAFRVFIEPLEHPGRTYCIQTRPMDDDGNPIWSEEYPGNPFGVRVCIPYNECRPCPKSVCRYRHKCLMCGGKLHARDGTKCPERTNFGGDSDSNNNESCPVTQDEQAAVSMMPPGRNAGKAAIRDFFPTLNSAVPPIAHSGYAPMVWNFGPKQMTHSTSAYIYSVQPDPSFQAINHSVPMSGISSDYNAIAPEVDTTVLVPAMDFQPDFNAGSSSSVAPLDWNVFSHPDAETETAAAVSTSNAQTLPLNDGRNPTIGDTLAFMCQLPTYGYDGTIMGSYHATPSVAPPMPSSDEHSPSSTHNATPGPSGTRPDAESPWGGIAAFAKDFGTTPNSFLTGQVQIGEIDLAAGIQVQQFMWEAT